KPLRSLPPEQVVVGKGGNELSRSGVIETHRRSSRGVLVHHPIDAAMLLVAVGRLICAPLTSHPPLGSRVVLCNQTVEVGDPERTIRSYIGLDRSRPRITARHHIPFVLSDECGAVGHQVEPPDEVTRRFRNE